MHKERQPQEPPPPAEPPPATSLYSVTVRGPNRDVANYEIKEHAKIGEIYTDHATRWLTDPGSLRFLIDEECIGDNQTPSSLSLAGITDSQNLLICRLFYLTRRASQSAPPTAVGSTAVRHQATAKTAATARATAEEGHQQQRPSQLLQRQRLLLQRMEQQLE